MVISMAIDVYNGFSSLPGINAARFNKPAGSLNGVQTGEKNSFEDVLKAKTQQTGELKFSKHANERMQQRNLDLSTEQWQRLENGVQRAGMKGIRESLVMVDDMAFIVNVSNNTVITAVGENDDKIFTNIDGAVIA